MEKTSAANATLTFQLHNTTAHYIAYITPVSRNLFMSPPEEFTLAPWFIHLHAFGLSQHVDGCNLGINAMILPHIPSGNTAKTSSDPL